MWCVILSREPIPIGSHAEVLVMEVASEPVVLIARDGALLSVLCARLEMAGDTPVTASASNDAGLDRDLRDRALLVIESACLSADPDEAVEKLRAQGWNGKILVLVDLLPDHAPPYRAAWADRRGGTAALMAALTGLRG
jgi:hypothetical protein